MHESTVEESLENTDAIRESVRRIMRDYDPDYWRRIDSQRSFPTDFFDAMAAAGFCGALVPAEFGGSDVGLRAASVIVEEVNRAGGDAAALNAQMAICTTLVRSGSDRQRRRYLPDVACGRIRFVTVAATESDSGADMSRLASTARRDGARWVINARKVLISMAEHTRLLLLLVVADEGPVLFLLDREQIDDRLEVRPTETIVNRMLTTLFVDDLRVPDSARIGAPGHGLQCLMAGFAPRRILAAAESIGNARFLLERSLEHARTRRTFDRPIGQNQGVQYPLTQAYAKVEAADLMRWSAIDQVRTGDDAGGRSALAKILASEAAWETARAALTTFGGWALTSELHVERKVRECSVYVFNNMLLSYVAQRVLELPRAF